MQAAAPHPQLSAQQGPGMVPPERREPGQSSSCSPRLQSLAAGYKKLGMDVCQEVVNKLGALFFLWLSLQSRVCLWRRVPGCGWADFSYSEPGAFWERDEEGLSLTLLSRGPGEQQEAAWTLHSGHRR